MQLEIVLKSTNDDRLILNNLPENDSLVLFTIKSFGGAESSSIAIPIKDLTNALGNMINLLRASKPHP